MEKILITIEQGLVSEVCAEGREINVVVFDHDPKSDGKVVELSEFKSNQEDFNQAVKRIIAKTKQAHQENPSDYDDGDGDRQLETLIKLQKPDNNLAKVKDGLNQIDYVRKHLDSLVEPFFISGNKILSRV